MARGQVLSGWTMLTVQEVRQKYKTVHTVDEGHSKDVSISCLPANGEKTLYCVYFEYEKIKYV